MTSFCFLSFSDFTFNHRGHNCDNSDISEKKAADGCCITEGGKQVRICDGCALWKLDFFLFSFSLLLYFLSVSRAIGHIMSTLFYPIFTFLLLAICIAYCAMTAVYPSDWSCYREVTQLSWTWRVKKWSLNWPRAVSVTVCFLNSSVLSFLSSSGNAVYKVTAVDDKCTYVDHTCNPKVSAYVTVFCCTAFDSRLESWTKHFKSTVVRYYFLFSSVSDLQSDQRHQSVSWLSVHVRLLWRWEYIPPLHPGTSSLQPVCVPLVGQLHHRPGAVHPGWGLRVLLLGPEEAWRHPALSTLLLVQQGHTVFHFYTPKTRDVRWCQTTDVM